MTMNDAVLAVVVFVLAGLVMVWLADEGDWNE